MLNAMFIQPIVNTLLKNREYKVSILACEPLSSLPSIKAAFNALLFTEVEHHINWYVQVACDALYRQSLLIQMQELFFSWHLWLFSSFIPARCSNHFSSFVRDIILFQPIGNSLRSGFKH